MAFKTAVNCWFFRNNEINFDMKTLSSVSQGALEYCIGTRVAVKWAVKGNRVSVGVKWALKCTNKVYQSAPRFR